MHWRDVLGASACSTTPDSGAAAEQERPDRMERTRSTRIGAGRQLPRVRGRRAQGHGEGEREDQGAGGRSR